MKRKIVKILMLALAGSMILGMAGCGAKSKGETAEKTQKSADGKKDHIKIGGTVISQVTYDAIKPHFEKLGYTTEFVVFDANPIVLEACNSGEVDMALGQHKKFVESFNQNQGGSLAMAKPYGYYTGIGLYSKKYKTVEEIPNGAKIAIMNDAMNMDIALWILEETGLIKIDESVETATIADIKENPKKLEIMDMDQAQTVTALEDMDASCVFFTHMANAGQDPTSYIARDSKMIKYPMGVIVKEADVKSSWATDFAKGFKIQEVKDTINKAFPGVFEFYEDDKQAE